jgi:hypothetical protein
VLRDKCLVVVQKLLQVSFVCVHACVCVCEDAVLRAKCLGCVQSCCGIVRVFVCVACKCALFLKYYECTVCIYMTHTCAHA